MPRGECTIAPSKAQRAMRNIVVRHALCETDPLREEDIISLLMDKVGVMMSV